MIRLMTTLDQCSLIVLLGLAAAGGPAIAAASPAGSLRFVEHPDCTEMRLTPAPSVAWHMGTPAGGASELMLRNLGALGASAAYPLGPFDKSVRVPVERQGAATPALDPSRSYSYHNYWLAPSRRRNVGVAEFVTSGRAVLYDYRTGDSVPFKQFDNYRYFFGEKIFEATLYSTETPDAGAGPVPCIYAATQEALSGFFEEKCVWLDEASRSSSGKPFCFSSAASTRDNDAADMALPDR